jgi:hypothetical protein
MKLHSCEGINNNAAWGNTFGMGPIVHTATYNEMTQCGKATSQNKPRSTRCVGGIQ